MNINEKREEKKKSDRYAQFYTKSSTYQTEMQHEEVLEVPRRKKSSKSTALSILAIFISFMAFLTSFIAIAIASIKPKEVVVEKEVPVYQETKEESKQEFYQKDSDTIPVQLENKINTETTIENQVVFDQDGIVITATGIELNGSFMGHEVKFLIENNTEKNLVVQARDVSVNGYMVFTSMSAEVSSGKKINDSLTIDIDSLEESGIEDIEYIDFSFHIFNNDSWDDSIDTEMIHIETSSTNRYTEQDDCKYEESEQEESCKQEENNDNNAINEKVIQEEPKTDPKNMSNIFYVGDTLETKKVRLSYISCGDYVDDNMFVEAGANNKLIYFEFEFENIGNTDTSVGFYDFDCYADGYEAKNSMSTADNAMTSIATLSPGRKMGGIVVFEVPKNAENIEIEYETSFWTQDKAIFVYE